MRRLLVVALLALGPITAGCGASPTAVEHPAPSLAPLVLSRPTAQVIGIDLSSVRVRMSVMVHNPNGVPMTMRRLDGSLRLNGALATTLGIDLDQLVEAGTEQPYVLDLELPMAENYRDTHLAAS